MVIDYIQCSANIQILATDVLHRVIEIFKLFNSRTCQVILGAGAIRSAGLKSITAKHIALASQSLGLVITLLPYVRECLRQTLTTHQEKLLIEFDRILKDYREHQSELHNNLVTIMAERAQFHGKTMQATDWDVKQAGPKDFSPTPNMELLVKETKTLHKVLGRYLSIDILQSIMSQVLRMYSQKLMAQIQEVDITTAQGKQRLLADVQYFIERLSTLDHVEPPNNSLEVLVNNITIGAKPRPPLPSR
ncbi:Vps54-like protein-domain-containing protein [Dimargaris cristalligena]|uniref:Vps54-like protein-domain-containing protein n=1 Tax=Dimargaris cristalligena TaxID=215637 RepID=A0A4P9ZRY5_9FUNG|nr:Vps54-like protein-domain-containing protein [Dimargaris cristalligena]|eukprot:RKP35220.1 Vps54-like protein-domain-containing protein [Dimargaris cristalligena]